MSQVVNLAWIITYLTADEMEVKLTFEATLTNQIIPKISHEGWWWITADHRVVRIGPKYLAMGGKARSWKSRQPTPAKSQQQKQQNHVIKITGIFF